jgi:hypothetical protein
MSNRNVVQGLLVLVGVACIGGSLAFAQTSRLRSGGISKFAAVDSTAEACNNTGTTLVQMPDMVRNFTVGGTTATPAVVTFSGAYWSALASQFVRVRLTIDGVANPGPGTSTYLWLYQQDEDGGAPMQGSHGFTFITDALQPGQHTARIQWATSSQAGQNAACIGSRSLVVLYK